MMNPYATFSSCASAIMENNSPTYFSNSSLTKCNKKDVEYFCNIIEDTMISIGKNLSNPRCLQAIYIGWRFFFQNRDAYGTRARKQKKVYGPHTRTNSGERTATEYSLLSKEVLLQLYRNLMMIIAVYIHNSSNPATNPLGNSEGYF